jgi:hypothetical protein
MISGNLFRGSAFYTIRADVGLLRLAADLYPDLLKIGKPAPFRKVVGMTDIIACHRFLSAYRALFTHIDSPYIFVYTKDSII